VILPPSVFRVLAQLACPQNDVTICLQLEVTNPSLYKQWVDVSLKMNMLLIVQTLLTFYKTSYLNGEVIRTEPSPSVRVPWFMSQACCRGTVSTSYT
jgi:hypothetical protein